MEEAWEDWVADEHAFQQTNLDAIRKYPLTPVPRRHAARARIRVARLLTIRSPERSTPASTTPAPSRTSAASRRKTARVQRLVDIKGPLIYTVTSLVWNPLDRHALLHDRQRRAPRSGAARPGDASDRGCSRRTRASATSPTTRADDSIWGLRHLNGLCTLVRMKAPYTRVAAGRDVPVRHRDVRHRRVERRHARVADRSARSAASRTSASSTSRRCSGAKRRR